MTRAYDLAVNYPLRAAVAGRLARSLATLAPDIEALAYPHVGGRPGTRRAFARWMTEVCGHGPVDADELLVTLGAQHALTLALRPQAEVMSRTVMVDELTFHGFRMLASHLGIACRDVSMDADGMRADALEDVARRSGSRLVYLQPTLHNPTTVTMPLARRQEIAEVAERLDLTIVEGDVYGALAYDGGAVAPSFTALLPHRTRHAGGMSKVLGPGLRVGWLRLPGAELRRRTSATLGIETDGLPSLLSEVVARWIDDGTARAVLEELSTAMRTRAHLARDILGPDLVTYGASLHAWLPSADAGPLRERIEARGVRVGDVTGYVASGRPGVGVRLCLAAEEDQNRLEAALRLVAASR